MIYETRTTAIARSNATKQSRIFPVNSRLPRSLRSLAMTTLKNHNATNELLRMIPHPSFHNEQTRFGHPPFKNNDLPKCTPTPCFTTNEKNNRNSMSKISMLQTIKLTRGNFAHSLFDSVTESPMLNPQFRDRSKE